MLTKVTQQTMFRLLQEAHPFWAKEALSLRAEEYVQTMDARLDDTLAHFAETGARRNFEFGEFSTLAICALQNNCAYVDAVILMDEYLKDPVAGRAAILRRSR